MIYHILNGDALIERFKATTLKGEIVVARECLVEGDVSGERLFEFYERRANYLAATYGEKSENYFRNVASECNKLLYARELSGFNLWFGYDLFCQVNMWFIISLLQTLKITKYVFVVYPSFLKRADIWKDFGKANASDLKKAFDARIELTAADLDLGNDLWNAYRSNNLAQLAKLSKSQSHAYPYLEEVVRAHLERFPAGGGMGRPEMRVREIMRDTGSDFSTVFRTFSEKEGVYGFGDVQVKHLYDKILTAQRE
jgi:hypothetical protein